MKWITIAITAPEANAAGAEAEAAQVRALIETDAVEFVHLRKPDMSEEYMRTLIEAIPLDMRCRLTLHDHFNPALSAGIGGLHLNSRFSEPPAQWQGRLSRSCHTLEEAKEWAANPAINYVTLSPVFDSISKPGHHAAFTLKDLEGKLPKGKVIALGGVTPERFGQLQHYGFAGASMLGYIWEGGDFAERLRALRLRRMLTEVFPLLTITDTADPDEAVAQACAARRGGCYWFQLRMKEADTATRAETLRRMRMELGKDVLLMVDDDVQAALEGRADGVHLGTSDMSTREARALLGPAPLLGRTAHNAEEAMHFFEPGVDYFGIGPVRFTATKANLAPVLGTDGLKSLLAEIRARGVYLPVTAIGGIRPDDVPEVMRAGADGVAVSGAIVHAPDPERAARAFLHDL